jgi:hypothetical protein
MHEMYKKKSKKDQPAQHTCERCNKTFKCRTSIYQHHCRVLETDKLTALQNEINDLRLKIERLQPNVVNINTYNNNVTTVNAFGSENISSLRPQYLDRIVKLRDAGHVALAKHIHFGMHQNLNVVPSKAPRNVITFDGEIWSRQDQRDVVDVVLQNVHTIMKDHLKANEDRVLKDCSETLIDLVWDYIDRFGKDLGMMVKLRDKVNSFIDEKREQLAAPVPVAAASAASASQPCTQP